MATFGVNDTSLQVDNESGDDGWHCSGTLPEAGTLDSVTVYTSERFSTPRIRVAVYQGGTSDDDIDGASLVWESGQEVVSGTGEMTITADSSALSAGRIWLAASPNGEAYIHEVNSGDVGDWNTGYFKGFATTPYASGFPATAGASTIHNGTQAIAGFITYTATGGGVSAGATVIPRYYRMLMGN